MLIPSLPFPPLLLHLQHALVVVTSAYKALMQVNGRAGLLHHFLIIWMHLLLLDRAALLLDAGLGHQVRHAIGDILIVTTNATTILDQLLQVFR